MAPAHLNVKRQTDMTSQVEKFATVAAQFCEWAEGGSLSPEREAQIAHQFLCDLSQLALQLPPEFGEEEPAEITYETWHSIYRRFGSLPFNYYSHCFDPQEVPNDATTADLADDLADIWRDLKGGLSLFRSGHVQAAVWEWKQSYWQHWGRHAAGGIYALHCWLAEHRDVVA
ncbi:DUF5063 domain-containing protein [Undibacterium macrobrachii]|uniref:DUF5063 domain-containing protein n=1 Tax=Undibacterium macrobrachii TaxID=1119058 RepID=A0ABQ2XI69_9BURK|nr:DUF5063 domain-containing protein [Undibacterium macrobrachii]GGX17598.1 hypothetical protein GCM10011282_24590 [Undibacterium macrobrachii]